MCVCVCSRSGDSLLMEDDTAVEVSLSPGVIGDHRKVATPLAWQEEGQKDPPQEVKKTQKYVKKCIGVNVHRESFFGGLKLKVVCTGCYEYIIIVQHTVSAVCVHYCLLKT